MTKDEIDRALTGELLRILGEDGLSDANELLMVLPLTNEEDAIAFLRTVPEGAGPHVIQQMAARYRLENPLMRYRKRGAESDNG